MSLNYQPTNIHSFRTLLTRTFGSLVESEPPAFRQLKTMYEQGILHLFPIVPSSEVARQSDSVVLLQPEPHVEQFTANTYILWV